MDDSKQYIGTTFDGRYRIERIVGIGGMAFVYEATDIIYNKKVAIKLLKDKFSDDSRAVKRFINESKSLELLSHPNIVKIYDISVNTPHKYIVMEYINGITLRKYMNYKLPLEWREAVEFTEQILLALDHAHTKGVVHRDIKPQNIMIMQGGKIRVTDFGIAKIPKSESLTLVDKAIGTVYYISPEQAGSRKIDARSDIYSLGIMLYEMVTGKLPFTADTPIAVIFKHIHDAPTPPTKLNPTIPRGLEQIILCAMEKNPQNRYQSAAQMLRHLRRLKLDPNTVFLQPKPVPRTPTSETVLKKTSRPHRDTSEFDFALSENDRREHSERTPLQSQSQQQTQSQPQQSRQSQPQQARQSQPQQARQSQPQQSRQSQPQQARQSQPQQSRQSQPQQARQSQPQQSRQSQPQQARQSQPQQSRQSQPQQARAWQQSPAQNSRYQYHPPNTALSNRTIPLSQMHRPVSNKVLIEEERKRRSRVTSSMSQASSHQRQTKAAPKNNGVSQASRSAHTQRRNNYQSKQNSNLLLFIILILLVAVTCMLLLYVTLSDTSTASDILFFSQAYPDKTQTLLIYLKQVVL